MEPLQKHNGHKHAGLVGAFTVFSVARRTAQCVNYTGSFSNLSDTYWTVPRVTATVLISLLLLSLVFGFVFLKRNRERQHELNACRRGGKDYETLELMFNQLTRVASEAFWFIRYNPQRVTYFNPSMERMWGLKADEFAANPSLLYDRIHPEDRDRVCRYLTDSVRSEVLGSFRDEFRILLEDGTVRWVRSEATGMKGDDGQLAWTAGTMENITARIEVEDALKRNLMQLRDSEQRYRSLFENAPVSLWEKDYSGIKSRLDRLKGEGIRDLRTYLQTHPNQLRFIVQSGRILSVNGATVDLFHAGSAAELVGSLDNTLTGETLQAHTESLQCIWDGKSSFEIETRHRAADGEEKQIILAWSVVPGFERDYGKVLVSASDITQLKRYEDQLLKSQRLFETFMDNLPAAAWIKDKDLRFVYGNKYYKATVPGSANLVGKSDFEIWPHESAKRTREDDLAVQDSVAPLHTLLILPTPDGNEAHYAVTKFPIKDSDGSVSLGGIGIDISDRIEAQRKLESSMEEYRELVETINEVVFSLDENGFLTYISPFSAKSFGLTADELVGVHYSFLVHPEDLSMVAQMVTKSKKGHFSSFECRFTIGDRPIRWGAVHMRPFFRDGRHTGIHGVILEVTRRKETELRAVQLSEQLRAFASRLQTTREDERAAIAREIHDELGQKLTRLKIGLSLVTDNLSRKRFRKSISKDMSEMERSLALVDGLIRDVRRIATELRPEELDDLGLADAIKRYADQYARQTGLVFRFRASRRTVIIDSRKSAALFRIFQEAVTNILKHARASEVEICLSKYRGKVTLDISDNGRGLGETLPAKHNGLGILSMQERAASIGGTFSISKGRSGGTVVHVEIDA